MFFDKVLKKPGQKRTVLRVLNIYIFFYNFTYNFRAFFHGSVSGFFTDPDPDSGKRLIRIRKKNPDPKHSLFPISRNNGESLGKIIP